MPELPEVEVTRRGIAPHLEGLAITGVVVRHRGMRWPVPADLEATLTGLAVMRVERRGKYLLIAFDKEQASKAGATPRRPAKAAPGATPFGWLILHLGMSGSLRVVPHATPPRKHEHFDLVTRRSVLRLHDPRRFGAVLWHAAEAGPLDAHPLLAKLGVEPFGGRFDGDVLFHATRNRKAPIKQLLLAGDIVVGVGNIYASEALFRARIHPKTAAGRISRERYRRLAAEILLVLQEAIHKGGSTLRDFTRSDGEPGYFQLEYFVYGRDGQPCRICGRPIRLLRQGQRSTFYCAHCQT